MKKILYFLLLPLFFCACGDDEGGTTIGTEDEHRIDWYAAADSSSTALLNHFWNTGSRYFNYDSNGNTQFHYWPQAHALDVLLDAYLRTDNTLYSNYFDQWFEGVRAANGNSFLNTFYDDMEWNALAILRAYQATGDQKYKDAVLEIWKDIKTGWNEQARGGIAWRKDQPYSKNACSNGPACILAARLYQEFGDEEDREWAFRIYDWEKSTLFNANNGAVADNINANTGEVNSGWIFTYNQGTFVGSAVELFKITNQRAYLNDAILAADYTISTLVSSSILKDEGNGDGGLFKGIFIRYFAELIQQDRLEASTARRYIQFLEQNAETLWQSGTSKPAVLFGTNWQNAPAGSTGLTEQLSGCMLIEAMAKIDELAD